MVDYNSPAGRTRDIQDGTKRGLWGAVTYESGAGAHMTVRGTGTTVDSEVPLMNTGYGFNLATDSNAEVVMLALGSDPNDKVAFATIPKDMQHPWGAGQGGVQHPSDPSRRIEFNGAETWLKDGSYVLGHDREVSITVSGSSVTINMAGAATLNCAGALTLAAATVEITSGALTHNGVNIGDSHVHPHGDPAGVTGGPS
jgi:hypothetical protein